MPSDKCMGLMRTSGWCQLKEAGFFGFLVLFVVLAYISTAQSTTLTPSPSTPPNGQPGEAPSGPGWISKCESQFRKGPLECSLEESLFTANTRQLVASVVVHVRSNAHETIMAIRVPAGIYLPAGLSLKIDSGKAQSVPLQTCNAQGCFAEMPLSADLLTALTSGKRLSISFQDMAKKDVVLPFPLDNFAEVFGKIQ